MVRRPAMQQIYLAKGEAERKTKILVSRKKIGFWYLQGYA